MAELGEEDRDAFARFGCDVGIRAGDLFDEPVETEASQVVGHLVPRVVAAEESGNNP